MKKILRIAVLCFVFGLLTNNYIAKAADYILGPGDCLDISVWGYEELQTRALEIRPDGKLAFPLAGDIQAAGVTPSQLSDNLTEILNEYLINPKVTVNVIKCRAVRVYVLGEVNKPGMYEIQKSHNLIDSISLAGGYTKFTAKKDIYVVRKSNGQYIRIDLDKLLKKGDLTQNIELYEGDVVYLAANGVNFINDVLPYITACYQIKVIFSK